MSPDRERVRLPQVPRAVRWLVGELEEAGFETWAVGGAVRDELRGEPSADWDFATRARPAEVRRVFRRTVPVGIEHGTVGVLARDGVMYEVTTFRRDVETDGRHAVVAFSDSLDEDLARRDFTINAVAWHPLREELHDPYDGRSDLRARILRTVGEPRDRFAEDHLRILRALRFAGRFGLTVDPPTWRAIVDGIGHLAALSPERVREELFKVLEGPGDPAEALGLYRDAGVLGVLYPELAALDPALWDRTLAEVRSVPRRRGRLRLAALLAHIGIPRTLERDVDPASVTGMAAVDDTAARAAARAAALLLRLRDSNAGAAGVAALVAGGTEPPHDRSPEGLRRWLARTDPARLTDHARLWVARHRASPDTFGDPAGVIRQLRAVRDDAPPLAVGDLALDGRDLIRLGLRPGPGFGRILATLLDEVLADPARNVRDVLEARALELAEDGL